LRFARKKRSLHHLIYSVRLRTPCPLSLTEAGLQSDLSQAPKARSSRKRDRAVQSRSSSWMGRPSNLKRRRNSDQIKVCDDRPQSREHRNAWHAGCLHCGSADTALSLGYCGEDRKRPNRTAEATAFAVWPFRRFDSFSRFAVVGNRLSRGIKRQTLRLAVFPSRSIRPDTVHRGSRGLMHRSVHPSHTGIVAQCRETLLLNSCFRGLANYTHRRT